ncbi:MAG TPA: hypothetical protein VGX03_17260 [Candidatus Binatia bacterium]|jgi:hypothetical protein|nr:hypothetical protein [Candidatus Binatia bacterium]
MMASRLALFCLTSVLLGAFQVVAGEMVELRVETVLATNSSQEFDNRLTDIRPQLSEFRFSSYRLVQEERRLVDWGKQADFFLPGGRFLQVVPKGYINKRIALQVMLMEGTTPTPLIDTLLSIRNHGTLFVGGRKHQGGTLIIRIGAVADE